MTKRLASKLCVRQIFLNAAKFTAASTFAIVYATAASAQDTGENAENQDGSESIVVTGTRIQGVAPVGSPVIALDNDAARKAGLANSTDLLFQVPAIQHYNSEARSGGPSATGSANNVSLAASPDIRGLGPAATLSLVDNHRVPSMGPGLNLFDAESIPSIALQRVEVIADGASAIYGSDAIGGVINYIMHDPFNGLEVSSRLGVHDDSTNWKMGGIAGHKWSSGGIMLAVERTHRDRLRASDRPYLYNDDFRPYGGAAPSSQSFPGNVTIGGTSYAIPAGHTGALTLADLGAAGSTNYTSAWEGADGVPQSDVISVAAKFKQDLTGGIHLYADGFYANRDFKMHGAGASGIVLNVPNTNPYSPCNPANASANPQGITCTGSSTIVSYNLVGEYGAQDHWGHERVYNVTAGIKVDLPWDWKADLAGSIGHGESRSYGFQFNNSRADALLAGSSNGMDAFNPFCGVACNAASTLDYLSATSMVGHNLWRHDVSFNLSGSLPITLPGGAVRLATGAEYYRDKYQSLQYTDNNPTDVGVYTVIPSPNRHVHAFYGELYIPLLDMLDVSVAGRYESYSDAGNTFNPKIGFNFKPTPGLKLRGSYGKSFHAPSLAELNNSTESVLLPSVIAGSSITASGYTGPAGTVVATYPVGGNSLLTPETARTFSLGADWEPEFAPGLRFSATWYDIKYTGRVDYPAWNAGAAVALSNPAYAPFVIKNPRFWSDATLTQDQFDAFLASLTACPTTTSCGSVPNVPGAYTQYVPVPGRFAIPGTQDPTQVVAVIDGRRNNTSIIRTNGIDFTTSYEKSTKWGAIHLAGTATWVLSYKTAPVPGAAETEYAGEFTGPIKFVARAQTGFDYGRFSANVFMNYKGGYNIARQYIPAAAPDNYLKVASQTTVDLTLSYDTGEDIGFAGGALKNLLFTFGVQNVFSSKPPLVLNNTSPALLYNPLQSTPYGREISLQINKKF